MKRRKKSFSERIWICKEGYDDKMIHPSLLQQYLSDGWHRGRTNLPPGFREKVGKLISKLSKDGMKGHVWIYNIKTGEPGTIKKGEIPPEGWKFGRGNFDRTKMINATRKTTERF